MSTLVIVGQAPARRGDPTKPLATGPVRARLVELLGVAEETYDQRTTRFNLFNEYPGRKAKGDAFDLPSAKLAAERLGNLLAGNRVLLLGNNVAKAFGSERQALLIWDDSPVFDIEIAVLPHPSSINRWWNDPLNRRRAVRFMRKLGRTL